ncbi:MAG TPA: hypothetical protein ENH82_07330 [bacterium]|nr:hypothetical protein [bacterium]
MPNEIELQMKFNEQQIVLELESIQRIITKNFVCKEISLREALDNLRITAAYIKFDNECLRRELEYAKKKKSE